MPSPDVELKRLVDLFGLRQSPIPLGPPTDKVLLRRPGFRMLVALVLLPHSRICPLPGSFGARRLPRLGRVVVPGVETIMCRQRQQRPHGFIQRLG